MKAFSKHISYIMSVVLILVCITPAFAQPQVAGKYQKGKVFLYDGHVVEGKNLTISKELISLQVADTISTFKLSEVQQVMVKKGHAKLFAEGCGMGCLGISALAIASIADEDINIVRYALSATLWTAISAGIGYLVGYVLDDWSIVYFQPRTSSLDHRSAYANMANVTLLTLEGRF